MSLPRCDHCSVPMYEQPGTRSGAGPHGYWAVFRCKTVYCPRCKGNCTMIKKDFVSK
jgi:hypothetical protein